MRRASILVAVVLLAPPVSWGEPPRLDLHGDALPAGALARLGTVRLRHGRRIDVMRFSADGRRLATMDQCDLFVWGRATGRPLLALRPDFDSDLLRTSLGLSADGTTVAAADAQGRLHVWDIASGKERVRPLELPADGKGVYAPLFSADGKVLAALVNSKAALGDVVVYDAVSGRPLPAWKPDRLGWPEAISTDGALLAVRLHAQDFRVWNTATGKEVARLEASMLVDGPWAFSPDGRLFAVSGKNQSTYVWDVASGKGRVLLNNQRRDTHALGFSPDSKKLLLAAVESVRVIDLSTGIVTTYLTQEDARMFYAAFAPDGKTVVGGSNSELRFFDIEREKECGPNAGHTGPVLALRFAPDGASLATSGDDDTLRLWDAGAGKELRRWDHRSYWSRALAFTADGRGLLACDDRGWLRQWDVRSGAEVKRWDRRDADRDWDQTAVLSGDGKLLAVGAAQLHLWDPATGEKEAVLPNVPGKKLERWHRWERLAFSPDGRSVAAVQAVSGELCLWDVATKKLVRAFGRRDRGFPHRDYAVPLLFTPDGRELATVRQDGALTLWSVATGRVRELGPAGMVHTFAFSPDGRFLAVAMERKTDPGAYDFDRSSRDLVRVWDALTGAEVRTFAGHRGPVRALAFSPDGKRLASGSDDASALVWDVFGGAAGERPTAREREALWADLAAAEGGAAFAAQRRLLANPEDAAELLAARLKPVPTPDVAKVAKWVAQLDDASFQVREAASAELAKLGRAARPALLEALEKKPPPEAERRLGALLDALADPPSAPDELRVLRAVTVLEQLATPPARELLGQLAKGAPGALLTEEARAARERLGRLEETRRRKD